MQKSKNTTNSAKTNPTLFLRWHTVVVVNNDAGPSDNLLKTLKWSNIYNPWPLLRYHVKQNVHIDIVGFEHNLFSLLSPLLLGCFKMNYHIYTMTTENTDLLAGENIILGPELGR